MADLYIHSPVEEIHDPLFTAKQVQVFVKRDDMIHPFISGNKWRKLKYLLKSANQQQKTHLVTFGGAWSNHLLATACASAKYGLKSTGFVRGEHVTNTMLSLCKMFGMDLIFTDRQSYQDKRKLFHDHFSVIQEAYFIDEGGASPEAALGCAELVDELKEQYDHMFVACGTGTTAAGIINGLNQISSSTLLHAVPVLKNAGFIQNEIEKYLTTPAHFNIHLNYHFGGYAKTTAELMAFIRKFTSATGILLDPVYTGKLVFAVFDLIKQDYFKSGTKIIIIHTGGLIGLLGKLTA